MNAEENIKIVQKAYDAFKTGNVPGLLSLLSEDIEWTLPTIENVPFSGSRRGRNKVGEFFAAIAEHQESLQFEPRDFVAQDDKVVALGHYAWRIKSTGRTFESDFVHVFSIREGQATTFKEFLDTAAEAAAYRK